MLLTSLLAILAAGSAIAFPTLRMSRLSVSALAEGDGRVDDRQLIVSTSTASQAIQTLSIAPGGFDTANSTSVDAAKTGNGGSNDNGGGNAGGGNDNSNDNGGNTQVVVQVQEQVCVVEQVEVVEKRVAILRELIKQWVIGSLPIHPVFLADTPKDHPREKVHGGDGRVRPSSASPSSISRQLTTRLSSIIVQNTQQNIASWTESLKSGSGTFNSGLTALAQPLFGTNDTAVQNQILNGISNGTLQNGDLVQGNQTVPQYLVDPTYVALPQWFMGSQ
ncbi:hypothetical protein P7C73_g6056, partial [Tremellales sp. Uapishka_1]